MKTKLTIILILVFGLNLKLAAQSKEQLQDSVYKYADIAMFILHEHQPSFTDTIGNYQISLNFKKAEYFQHRIEAIGRLSLAEQDSLYVVEQRKFLESKYKIKLP